MIFLGSRTWPGSAAVLAGVGGEQEIPTERLTYFEEERGVVLVEAGQLELAGVGVKREAAVVDGADELYLWVKSVDDF